MRNAIMPFWQPGPFHRFEKLSDRLREHYYGGWVAPGIYYMGAAGVLRVGCLRIAGISGSFASGDLVKGLESIYNICWKLILYNLICICACVCVMFNVCVCDVHPCTINFACAVTESGHGGVGR